MRASAAGLSSPANGATQAVSSVSFSWTASTDSTYGSGFKNYTLQVDDNSDFSSPVVNHTGLTTLSSTETITPDNTYYWRILAYDNTGNSTVSASRTLVRETARLTALSWRNGTTSGAGTVSSIEAGQTVYLRVDAVAMSGQTVSVSVYEYDPIQNDLTTNISVTIGASGYGTAPWTAQWVDDGIGGGDPEYILRASGVSDSAQMTVTDTTGPSAPGLSSPANGATQTVSSVSFSWTASSDSAYGSGFKNYTLQVDDNSDFSSPVINHTGLSSPSSTETITPDGTYYWRVLAYDNNGNSTASASRTFARETAHLTALSWRNGTSSGAGTVTTMEAGQTVYLRVDAVAMSGQTVSVSVYEYDPIQNDLTTNISVTIGASGYGTAPWTARWVDDGIGGGDPEYILRASGVSDSAQMTVTDTTGPSAPSLSAPADAATLSSSSITFSWTASTDSPYGCGFKNYTLQVDDWRVKGSGL